MKKSDLYHKWVEWDEQDQICIGKCPDLITGNHGDDPVQLYTELCGVVEEIIDHFESNRRSLPRHRKPWVRLKQANAFMGATVSFII